MKSVSGRLELNDTLFGVHLEDTSSIHTVVGYFEFPADTVKGKDICDATIVKVHRRVAKIRFFIRCQCAFVAVDVDGSSGRMNVAHMLGVGE